MLSIRRAPFFAHLVTEPARYDAWAWDIVRGVAPVRPPFDEAPGYPYFVALVYWLGGRSHVAVCAAQAILDAATCAAVTVVGRRIAGARAGLVAGLLLAIYGPAIYFVGQLEPVTLTLAAVTLCFLATPWSAASDRRLVLYGAAFALGLFVRSELLLALPLVLVHAALLGGKRAVLRVALAPALVLGASLAINFASSRHVVLTTTGAGANLWIGNGSHADGVSPFLPGDDPVVREVEARATDAIEADAIFRDRALGWMAQHPGRTARLASKKALWTFANRELPNASDIEWETRQSWLFRVPLFPLSLGLLLPLAAIGLFARDDRRRSVAALLAPVSVALVVCVVFFTNARFRMVMVPSLALLGGIGLAHASALPRKRALLAALVALLVAWSPLFGLRSYRIAEIDQNTAAIDYIDNGRAKMRR